jgi:ribosome assembly protein RRB1
MNAPTLLLTSILDTMEVDQQTFMPGRHKLEAGQSLAPDTSAYEMLHTFTTAWPCLSFDIISDLLGYNRKTYPATVYAVAGTQAESRRSRENELTVMKLSSLSRMERTEDSDSEEDDNDAESEIGEPILETKSIPMNTTTNRIRAHRFPPTDSVNPPKTLTATMTEDAELLIHDITPHLTSFDRPGTIVTPSQSQPIANLKMHRSEGYAVAWSTLISTGRVLSGDNDGKIFSSSLTEGKWVADTRPFTGHKSSVEDLEWSPNERNVFASASSDGTIKVWDIRSKSRKPAVDVKISNTDVNVLSWSKLTNHLLASGADDGEWAVWDLRQWKPSSASSNQLKPESVASFTFHKEQITSVEWHPTDDSIVAVAAGDNTLTLWDLAVELDDEESRDTAGVADVPPQLLFVHYMENVKECHWHPQIPGTIMGTGGDGFG